LIFIGISKAQTAPFVYLFLRCGYYNPNVVWTFAPTFANTIAPLVPLFIIYDFFYTALHWLLHIKSIYSFVHKHHHVQKAPSRANVDAINVHPVEFFLGEYNHLLSLYLCARYVCQVHVVGTVLFLAVGGALAGINHTRYDIVINVWGVRIFDSKAHDVHHRIPQSNYGQYTMLWDYVFGTFRYVRRRGQTITAVASLLFLRPDSFAFHPTHNFRILISSPYNPKDRISPDAQLDPTSGKSFAYMKEHRS
jgi:sterol desaturase/sphingolipid hydroxylase (fatty acid hydroxylase superfamily)